MYRDRDKYLVGTADLFPVKNRNEVRVIKCLQDILAEPGCPSISEKALRDTYAYTLNRLPARYAQAGTIILRDPVRMEDIRALVHESLDYIYFIAPQALMRYKLHL